MLKHIADCPVCEQPLMCAPGQIIRFHRGCRIEGKKRFGRSTGVKKFEVNSGGELTPKVVVE